MLDQILSIRKNDGTDYESDTLTSYHRSIARYLKENKYPFDMVIDKQFQTSKQFSCPNEKSSNKKGKVVNHKLLNQSFPTRKSLWPKKGASDSQVQNSSEIKCGYKTQCFSDFVEELKIINFDTDT